MAAVGDIILEKGYPTVICLQVCLACVTYMGPSWARLVMNTRHGYLLVLCMHRKPCFFAGEYALYVCRK